MNYKISHPTQVVECEITLPSSKSISNRLLIIQALCEEHFQIKNISNSEDTISLQKALNSYDEVLDVGAAGTSFRFLTAFLSIAEKKETLLTGSSRMKQRPIKELVDALRILGSYIEYVEEEDFPPLKIIGQKLRGEKIQIDGSISSQFVSALLLISPIIENGIEIEIIGELVSKPYIEMTLSLMEEYGVNHSWNNNVIKIQNQRYIPKDYVVDADWSAASFWFQIASLSERSNIKLNGLSNRSLQGDQLLTNLYTNLGVRSEFIDNTLHLTKNNNYSIPETLNLIETPDLYQPIKCTLFGLGTTATFKGISTIKDKETNRLYAVEHELEKLSSTKIIDTYNDHRMAMSFAPLSLVFGDLQINNVCVVQKSYPNYWEDLKKAGFKISP